MSVEEEEVVVEVHEKESEKRKLRIWR